MRLLQLKRKLPRSLLGGDGLPRSLLGGDRLPLQGGLARISSGAASDALAQQTGRGIWVNVPVQASDDAVLLRKPRSSAAGKGGVLVVGVDSLLTQLAKCCKPAPPDAISGCVTRGQGVSVHRADCSNLRNMVARSGDRVIEVQWGAASGPKAKDGAGGPVYPVDISVEAVDRQGLLRDISEVFTKEKMNVIGVQTQTIKSIAWMTFTVEVPSAARLGQVLRSVGGLEGVRSARRR